MKGKQQRLKVQKSCFIRRTVGKEVTQFYHYDASRDKIGQGSYGAVYKVKHIETGQMRALKVIKKNSVVKKERLVTELKLMEFLDHPNILRLFETFEDDTNLYMVLELFSGGDVFDKVLEQGQICRDDSFRVFCEMIRAINYYQRFGIVHRDLKPENMLFFDKEDISSLSLIDFGIARKCQLGQTNLKSKSGTAYYVAPEVLNGSYDQRCDIWSAGVILYVILCGYPPFYGENELEILMEIKKGVLNFTGPEWDDYEEPVKDLISGMISPANQRTTTQQIIQSPFLRDFFFMKLEDNDSHVKFLRWLSYPRLKQLGLLYLATQIDQITSSQIKQIFFSINQSQSGSITKEEFTNYYKGRLTSKQINTIFYRVDVSQNNTLDYFEFVAVMLEQEYYETKLNQLFAFLSNHQPVITKSSIKSILLEDTSQRWSHIHDVDLGLNAQAVNGK